MKKLFIIAAMAVATLSAQAQERLVLSTYAGTNIAKYDGKVCNVNISRFVYTGWNTIALPFDMSEQELNDVFGSDCRLERLSGAEDNGAGVMLNFTDCKASGMKANTPYMLYYTGESGTKKIQKEAEITDGQSALSFTTESGDVVTMEAVRSHTDGKGFYGVLARDNAEVKFVSVDSENTNGFYATRCYVRLSSGNSKLVSARHLGEATSINAIARQDELVDVYTVAGAKVATQIHASEVANLRPAIYIVKGQKILVK